MIDKVGSHTIRRCPSILKSSRQPFCGYNIQDTNLLHGNKQDSGSSHDMALTLSPKAYRAKTSHLSPYGFPSTQRPHPRE